MTARFILRCKAPDRPGIVAAITGFLAARNHSILEAADFADRDTGHFFVRVEFSAPEDQDGAQFGDAFRSVASAWDLTWTLRRADEPMKTLILVSKFDHCLHDLLYRARKGELNIAIPAIISNHEDCRWHADRHDIPYHYIPATPATKPEAEARITGLIEETGAELIVLARYMQILSEEMCAVLDGRCINIHHSFLPSFKGARPYHQAYARGVKLIGATAHYVTTDLDEGPIISQDVARVDHRRTPGDMIAKGRDIEARVLAEAVKAHAEGRIFLNDHKTVVFD